jgi:pyrroloquinoline quinone biosynthesis protein D
VSPDAVARRRAGAEGSYLGLEYVLLDPEGKMLRGLNPTGAKIWELLDGQRTLAEVARLLGVDHPGDEAQVLGDVCAFVEALADRGLVDVHLP